MKHLKTLNDWENYLDIQHPPQNIILGLERIQTLLPRLLPKKFNCPIITVAGTNGKGSCVATLESILQTAGYKTGVYTSPHLWCVNERIRFNNRNIGDKAFTSALAKVAAARGQTPLTYFEFLTLAAFTYFYEKNPDMLILEIGVGGRLDAVNVLDPNIAIITNIDYDHCALLGDTRVAIAREKSGIMRPQQFFVCGDFFPPTSLKSCSEDLKVDAQFIGRDYWWQSHPNFWEWGSRGRHISHLPYNHLLLRNSATALAALKGLDPKYKVSDNDIRKGLARIHLPARQFRQKNQKHKVMEVFDVAHNPQGLRALAHLLAETPISGKNLAVFSMLGDKSLSTSVQPLLNKVDRWFIAPLATPRAAPLEQLKIALKNKDLSICKSVSDAYRQAQAYASAGDRIIVCGSFYTVAECLKNRV